MEGRRIQATAAAVAIVATGLSLNGCTGGLEDLGAFDVASTVEHRLSDGGLYTPSTQSFLRGHHWLENLQRIHLAIDDDALARFDFESRSDEHTLTVHNFPIEQTVARLHYSPASPPDDFDAFNLMLAEYSRNGLSIPVGGPGDSMTHFETSLPAEVPWVLAGDYQFVPNAEFRPYRMAVINNCLEPGLWEINASDRAGEIYHGWFTLDPEAYAELVARTNGVDEEFAAGAVQWSADKRRLALDRLRTVESDVGRFALALADPEGPVGYSSQGSRQKLGRRFVQIETPEGELATPVKLGELVSHPVHMSNFIAPGVYSLTDRKPFDLTFLGQPEGVEIRRVRPLTHYDWRRSDRPPDHRDATHLEMTLYVGGKSIVIGNLPLPLLVRQEDYTLAGFGVGVLAAEDLAERRRYLIEEGPAPSFAYLIQEQDGELWGLNSHDAGIEQIFIRTRPFVPQPHWEITITSFERIVDLVKYRVEIPEQLLAELQAATEAYVSPLYFTYADDNVR
ncbi:MAG: hypothetical protein AAF560_06860 [Acidobacteriota bacterium]